MTARSRLLITGAAGGMGRACARLLGMTCDLILTDVAEPSLDAFAQELRAEGYTLVAVQPGDFGDDALRAELIRHLPGDAPFAVIHTAGLSPSMAGWQAIMSVNLIATVRLLDAIETRLTPGSVTVVIASAAGHMTIPHPEAAALLADPLAPGFLDRIGALIESLAGAVPASPSGLSYVLGKQAVLGMVERRAAAWGAKGARIVSISPGMILTPMGRKELAETPGAAELDRAAPAGRSGTPMDIAMAARFLLSDEASFITGSDLKVDGGSIALTRMMMGG